MATSRSATASTAPACLASCSPRVVLAAAMTLQMILSSGLILGWSGVYLMLASEGTFRHLCPPTDGPGSETGAAAGSGSASGSSSSSDGSGSNSSGGDATRRPLSCVESDVHLAGIFTIAQFAVSASPLFLGMLADRVGPRFTAVLCNTGVTLGMVLIAIGTQGTAPADSIRDLVAVGFCVMGAAGSGSQFTAFHVANVFAKNHALVTSIFSASFGVSSLIFPVLLAVWRAGGGLDIAEGGGAGSITASALFAGYAVVIACFIPFSFMLPRRSFELGDTCAFTWKQGFHHDAGVRRKLQRERSRKALALLNSSTTDSGGGAGGKANGVSGGVVGGGSTSKASAAVGVESVAVTVATAVSAGVTSSLQAAGTSVVTWFGTGTVKGSLADAAPAPAHGASSRFSSSTADAGDVLRDVTVVAFARHVAFLQPGSLWAATGAHAGRAAGQDTATGPKAAVTFANGHAGDAATNGGTGRSDADDSAAADDDEPLFEEKPPTLKSQALTSEFAFMVVFLALGFWRFNWWLASVNMQLRRITGGDAALVLAPDADVAALEDADEFTSVFSWIAPWGAFSAPFWGYCMDQRGLWIGAAIAGGLGAFHVVCALIPVLEVQVVSFVSYTVALEALFSWFFSAVGRLFGYTNYGSLSGIAMVAMGTTVLPVQALVDGMLGGDFGAAGSAFVGLNWILLAVGVAAMAYPLHLYRHRSLDKTWAQAHAEEGAAH